jgi:hypothetical protein
MLPSIHPPVKKLKQMANTYSLPLLRSCAFLRSGRSSSDPESALGSVSEAAALFPRSSPVSTTASCSPMSVLIEVGVSATGVETTVVA